jgi:peptidyl-prolyl cis-trans isomerase D
MAIIGAIRKRSTLLLIVIGGALVLFVLSDFLGNQGGGRRQKIEPVAKVYDDEIDFRELEFEVQQQITLQKESNPDYSPSGMEMFQFRQQRFNSKIRDYVYMKHCKDLGLAMDHEYSAQPAISLQEFRDLLMGNDPHPEIRRVFSNPQTGAFDPAQVKNVLDNQEQMTDIQRLQWHLFLEEIKKERLSTKYKNMIAKTFYLPTALAKNGLQRQS